MLEFISILWLLLLLTLLAYFMLLRQQERNEEREVGAYDGKGYFPRNRLFHYLLSCTPNDSLSDITAGWDNEM